MTTSQTSSRPPRRTRRTGGDPPGVDPWEKTDEEEKHRWWRGKRLKLIYESKLW